MYLSMKNNLYRVILPYVRKHLPFFLLASLFATIPLTLVVLAHGWPMNHEHQQFFIRTYIWADHIRLGDILPIWSSSDAYGYGTPLPLYYQKLFHIINAALFILLGSVKLATVATLYLFMMTGIYGLRAALRYLVSNEQIVTILPLVFPLTSYVLTDWFVRGAMAEISAVVIIPWLIWWCVKVLRTNTISYWIILIFPALFYAHNAIALISLIFVGISVAALCVYPKRITNLIQTTWKKCLICLVSVAVLIVPSLVLQSMMSHDYNPAEKIDDIYNIETSFQEPLNYLFNREYVWLQNWAGYTVQIDIILWASIVMATILLVGYRLNRGMRVLPRDTAVWAVSAAVIVYSFLQLKIAQPIYEIVHTLALIQFPWRMLAIITPLLILLLAIVMDRLLKSFNRDIGRGAVYIPLVVWLGLYVAFSPLTYRNNIEYKGIASYPARSIYAGGEYLPITYSSKGTLIDNKGMMEIYSGIHRLSSKATIKEITDLREGLERSFEVNSASAQEIALPVSYSRYMSVYVNDQEVKAARDLRDPRLLVTAPAGKSTIRVELPTVVKLVRAALDIK